MLQVIGSGFGRTGTLSTKLALEQLGFGPCYHMEEVMKRTSHLAAWWRFAGGTAVDWDALLDGFHSTIDFPASLVYADLLRRNPDAKVLHNVRDPERWYESARETIYHARSLFPGWMRRLIPPLGWVADMPDRLIWQQLFGGRFEDRAHAIGVFNEWTDEVKRSVPADRLLVFDVATGWPPLCAFLGVPVPNTPFPHVNERDRMLRLFGRMRAGAYGGLALVLLAIAALVYSWFG